jgi:hypothetical protein
MVLIRSLTHAAKVPASCSSWPREPGWTLAQVWNLQRNYQHGEKRTVAHNKCRAGGGKKRRGWVLLDGQRQSNRASLLTRRRSRSRA